MARVYVINDSGHDFKPAEKFGTIEIVSTGAVDKFGITEMLRTFQPSLDASVADDFVVLSGPTVMSSVLCSAFAAKHGRLNLLLWKADRKRGDHYVLRRLVF